MHYYEGHISVLSVGWMVWSVGCFFSRSFGSREGSTASQQQS